MLRVERRRHELSQYWLLAVSHFLPAASELYRQETQWGSDEAHPSMVKFREDLQREEELLEVKRQVLRKMRNEGVFDRQLAAPLKLSRSSERNYVRMAEKCKAKIEAREARLASIREEIQIERARKVQIDQSLADLISGYKHDVDDALLKGDPPTFDIIRQFQKQGLIPDLDFVGVQRAMMASGSQDVTQHYRDLEQYGSVAARLLKCHPHEVPQGAITLVACWYLAQKEPAKYGPMKYFPGLAESCKQLREDKDPFLTEHGLVDRAKVPPELGVIRLKGVGEMVVPIGWTANEAEIQDRWAQQQYLWATPAEVRAMSGEQAQQQNMHGITRILNFFEKIFKKVLEARRPSEEQLEHCNPLPDEKPFSGTQALLKRDHLPFFLSRETAKLHNTVPPDYRLKPVRSREQIYSEFLLPIAHMRGWQSVSWEKIQKDAFVN